jgi:hypothetical protein
MTTLSSIHSGKQIKPRRTVIYGLGGVGKSTFASHWPKPIFIPTEDGISDLDVDSFPVCKDFRTAYKAVVELLTAEHDYKTVVIDSADWLEQLCWAMVASLEGVGSISDIGWGGGYVKAANAFRDFLAKLDVCRDQGMHVVIVAHCEIKTFHAPDSESYDRYQPKLNKSTSAILQEWCDELLFANYKIYVREADAGVQQKRTLGVGTGERVIHTTERPSHVAKNRLNLPDELPLDFEDYKRYLV